MEKKELMAELEGLKSTLETSINEKAKAEIAEQLKAFQSDVTAKLAEVTSSDNADAVKAMSTEVAKLKADLSATVSGLQILESRTKSAPKAKASKVSFEEAFSEALEKNFDAIQAVKQGQPFKMELKVAGNMTLTGSLDPNGNLSGVATYSSRQALLPSQRVNMRELISTAISPTGLYVQYRESSAVQSLGVQTEGAAKTQVQYDFTEVRVVENYIAGFARFSKQMAKQLPYMQTTLPRLLTRDFYKTENAAFYAGVTAQATGVNTTTGTNPVEIIMDLIANQQAANFNASYVIVSPVTLAAINKTLLQNGYYPGAAGVSSVASGAVVIAGTPVVAASWATNSSYLVIDMDYIERVETEAVNITFAMEDADNFTKNLITARIECQEELNLMLPSSAIFLD
jgi:HK97 family phage major capsid protein